MLGGASLAFACSGQVNMVGISPPAASAGTSVRVEGEGASLVVRASAQPAAASPAAVQLRWNSLDGPVVGTATPDATGHFATSLDVPATAPGVYSLVAVVDNVGWGRAAIEVTPANAALTPAPAPTAWATSGTPATAHTGATAGSASATAVAAGAGLLGVGLVALCAGFTVSVARRRRAASASATR
jgi:hypothetical protein